MTRLDLLGTSSERIDLIGRRSLIPLREKLMGEIESAPRGTIFSIDFSQVEDINGSGVDEIIIKPLRWMQDHVKTHDKYVYLKNLSEEFDHAYNIHTTLCTEEISVLAINNDGTHNVLGELGGSLKEVLNVIYNNYEVTAREISEKLGKKLNLASTQLTTLFELRMTSRKEEQLEEGGRMFVYSSLFK